MITDILGFVVFGEDNGSHMHRSSAGAGRCGSCGYLIDRSAVDPEVRIQRRSFDLSTTYDGVHVASLRFKEHVRRMLYIGVNFLPLPADPEFFVIRPQTIVAFDSVRRRTRFEKLCPACGQYESVVGVTPPFLKQSDPLSNGFFRTDLEFGSGDAKGALLLVAAATRERLDRERFRGLTYHPVAR